MSVDPEVIFGPSVGSMFVRAHQDGQALSAYSYVLNRPTTLRDPDGREPKSMFDAIIDRADRLYIGSPVRQKINSLGPQGPDVPDGPPDGPPGDISNTPLRVDEWGRIVDADGNPMGGPRHIEEREGTAPDFPIPPEDSSKRSKKGLLGELINTTMEALRDLPFGFTGGPMEAQIPVGAAPPPSTRPGHVECTPLPEGC